MTESCYDVLVIGSGAAGLTTALRLPSSLKIALLAKGSLLDNNTHYAQGGISAVLSDSDSIASHIEDTLNAGAGLCHEAVVRFTVEQGPRCIQWLIDQGVPFTQQQNPQDGSWHYHLTQEGGHSHRRVIHAADATGRALEITLIEHIQQRPNVHLFAKTLAIDLMTTQKLGLPYQRCVGAYALDLQTGCVHAFRARFIVLASGGAGKVYLYTSNPDSATGDGIAMAWRAGCRVANMEFIQFHPTCLYHPQAKSFLLTEALRGEGAKLRLPNQQRFMDRFDPRGELAPRDIVARAIDHEMKRLGIDNVYLDISHQTPEFIQNHFPTIYQQCLAFGFDLTRQPVPVVPAAHYTCGGIMSDLNGRTDIPGLYAIGECAFTGLHGANRMASNSLLECLAFAFAATTDIMNHLDTAPVPPPVPAWDESRVTNSDEEVVVAHNWDELRRFMWDYVGIVRTDKRLQRAKRRVDLLLHEIDEYYGHFRISNDLIELRNLAVVADLIILSAQKRLESRGLHYTLDYPQPDDSHPPQDTILVPKTKFTA